MMWGLKQAMESEAWWCMHGCHVLHFVFLSNFFKCLMNLTCAWYTLLPLSATPALQMWDTKGVSS